MDVEKNAYDKKISNGSTHKINPNTTYMNCMGLYNNQFQEQNYQSKWNKDLFIQISHFSAGKVIRIP